MNIRRIMKVTIAVVLLLCAMVTTAFACECGGKHKTYAAKPESSTKLIAQAQTQLKSLGYKFTAPTGVLNASMRKALRSFQYDAALSKTGNLNNCTLYRLESRANAVKANRKAKGWKNLFGGDYRLMERGSAGSRVRKLNQYLYNLGYNTDPKSSSFNTQTYNAVKAFQRKYVKNRTADGKAGPYTLSTLEKIYTSKKK